ncbi:MAG: SPOR domain-containing protein [Meiothermus sp.]|uniref:SPOR domain-containing protein n=1 Tax=Meiothermus sp. TaxID=1955249 RepID=UPI00298EDAB7|nr:SPOR domain-containing protein [Meiothermus sp.]MCX7741098.1 SPOR domain-containing protein [Meiothermus sp.]MDW8090625.1 SPOR domain-containing protein [Meiothermus sp.]MDW8480541.1 SPOR domain-containing protein [Meiothermus sp.]
MGWLRTNWLDALIFLLVALIMAGVVLFLTGVNPFAGQQPSPSASQPQPTVPQAAPVQPVSPPNPTPPAPAEKPQSEPVVTVQPIPQPEPIKPVPAPPQVSRSTPSESPKTSSAPPPPPATPPQARRPSLAADPGGSWWVVVGAFSNPENALRLASGLRSQGYPARLEESDNLTRVWVGPYASQNRAQTVASTLSAHGPRITRQAPQSSPPRYLQVGAFRNAKSAQPVVDAVRKAGYPVVLLEEGGLIKVRVGPFADPGPAAAALREQGLEVLEVR